MVILKLQYNTHLHGTIPHLIVFSNFSREDCKFLLLKIDTISAMVKKNAIRVKIFEIVLIS